MNKDQNLSVIREACIQANPSRTEAWEYDTGEPVGSGYMKENPCRLADVLFALWKKNSANRTNIVVENAGTFVITTWKGLKSSRKLGPDWALHQDSLESQSPETLLFLADLLKTT